MTALTLDGFANADRDAADQDKVGHAGRCGRPSSKTISQEAQQFMDHAASLTAEGL